VGDVRSLVQEYLPPALPGGRPVRPDRDLPSPGPDLSG